MSDDTVNWECDAAVERATLRDLLENMADANTQLVQSASEHDALFATGRYAEFLFTCAALLRLSAATVRHRALVIFGRYTLLCVQHAWHAAAQAAARDNEECTAGSKHWRTVASRLANQLPLRVLTALQIASKLHTFCGLSVRRAAALLRLLGHSFTEEQIRRSEVRMLQTVDHCVPLATAVEHVEALLKTLQVERALSSSHCAMYHWWSVRALDAIAMRRAEFSHKAITRAQGNDATAQTPPSSPSHGRRVAAVGADELSVACGVLCVASAAVDGLANAEKLTEPLCRLTGVPQEDMADLCVAFIRLVFAKTGA